MTHITRHTLPPIVERNTFTWDEALAWANAGREARITAEQLFDTTTNDTTVQVGKLAARKTVASSKPTTLPKPPHNCWTPPTHLDPTHPDSVLEALALDHTLDAASAFTRGATQ